MDAREYIDTYRNAAKPQRCASVLLRPDLVLARNYPVTNLEIASLEEIRKLGLVWSMDRSITPPADVPWDHANATRTTVGDAADLIDGVYAFRKEGVEKAGATIGAGPLVLPAFRVSGSTPFLIDGCHRAVFIAIHGLDVELHLDILEGEADEYLLPDSTVPDAPKDL